MVAFQKHRDFLFNRLGFSAIHPKSVEHNNILASEVADIVAREGNNESVLKKGNFR